MSWRVSCSKWQCRSRVLDLTNSLNNTALHGAGCSCTMCVELLPIFCSRKRITYLDKQKRYKEMYLLKTSCLSHTAARINAWLHGSKHWIHSCLIKQISLETETSEMHHTDQVSRHSSITDFLSEDEGKAFVRSDTWVIMSILLMLEGNLNDVLGAMKV